jgi:hypothetical protein
MVSNTSSSDIILSNINSLIIIIIYCDFTFSHEYPTQFASHVQTSQCVSTFRPQYCNNHDLPEPQPLLLIPGGSKNGHGFYLPERADGLVTLATGQTIILACPGATYSFKNTDVGIKTAAATVFLALHFLLTQFLITSRNLHVKVTLSMLPEHLAVHVTTAQNVI